MAITKLHSLNKVKKIPIIQKTGMYYDLYKNCETCQRRNEKTAQHITVLFNETLRHIVFFAFITIVDT